MTLERRAIASSPHPLDRGAFVAYLLGGVVPLAALGVVVERYVLSPTIDRLDERTAVGLAALVVGIAVLSLFSFLMLRRLVVRAIEKNLAPIYHDALTGLPNRLLFQKRLEEAVAQAERNDDLVAVCFLDLDGFKRINDSLGHAAGDELIRQVASRLQDNLRATDPVARTRSETGGEDPSVSRLGGDEFTFVMPELASAEDASSVVWRVLEAIRRPFTLDGREVAVTASAGIAMYPADAQEPQTLLRNADIAMYWAKSCGRNNYQFFAESMDSAGQRRLNIERCLRRSLERYPFSLIYQPIRDAETARIVAVEALLRWEDPELGPVGPAEFIPVAEEAGLIAPLGEWVLRTACAQAKAWQDAGLQAPRMCVNASGIQIKHPSWVARVRSILERLELGPGALELEITESTILGDDDGTRETLHELSAMGVTLALDDFGTGYSSLRYLHDFPIDRVKIDQAFVQSLGTEMGRSLTVSVISMAHGLGITAIAEGVETEEQAAFLRESGCDELQGFLFSKPVPADELTEYLEREKENDEEKDER